MKKAPAFSSVTLASFAIPLVAMAVAPVCNLSDFGGFIINIISNILVPVLSAVALIVLLWSAFGTFILGANSEDTKEKGKNLMLWGLIGFFVMVSVWGLVKILSGSIQFGNPNQANPPAATGTRPT